MKPAYVMVDSFDVVKQFEIDLDITKTISLDLETWGLDCFTDKIRLAQVEVNDIVYVVNMESSDLAKSLLFTMV